MKPPRPLSRRARAYVKVIRAAMAQQPQGLSREDVARVIGTYPRGHNPTPEQLQTDLVAAWVRDYWPRSIPQEEAA